MAEELVIHDCWNQVGVWSSVGASCPELAHSNHCRNCDVYIQAGRCLLDREASAVQAFERGKHYAQPLADARQQDSSVTLFRLGPEWLALANDLIEEVVVPRNFRWIPHVSGKLVKGVANFNGEPRLVVSVQNLLGIEEASTAAKKDKQHVYPRMILMGKGQSALAFLVDEVFGNHRFHSADIKSVPDNVGKAKVTYCKGLLDIEQGQAGLLDGMLLLYGMEQGMK